MQWKLIVEQTLTRAAGPVSLALGLLGLAAALPALVGTTRPDGATLLPHPIAAVCFILTGMALLRRQAVLTHPVLWRAAGAIIAAAAATGLLINATLVAHEFPAGPALHVIGANTAIAFLGIGLILLLTPSAGRRAVATAIQLTFVCVLALAIIDIAGPLVRLQLVFPWYSLVRMPPPTAVGVLLVALALLLHSMRSRWYQAYYLDQEDRKFTLTSTLIVLLIALSAGIAGFSMMTITLEDMLKNNLRISLDHRRRIFEVALERAIDNMYLIGTRPRFVTLMTKVSYGSITRAEREEFERIFTNIIATTGVSAFELYDARGRRFGGRGRLVTDSEIDAAVRAAFPVQLRWQQGTLLHARVPMMNGGRQVATLVADMRLMDMDRLTADFTGLGETGTMAVCAPLADGMQCFPNRLNGFRVFKAARTMNGHSLPMDRALRGLYGIDRSRDAQGQDVMAAYGPIGDFDLGMVVRMRTSELYLPARKQLQYLLLVILVPVLIGLYLLRWQLGPLIRRLVHEVNERRSAEDRLSYLAHHDSLTGLPNRVVVMDRLEHSLAEAERRDRMAAVLFVDLDNFKIINDTLGHEAGDALLRDVAARLQAGVRRGDTVARMSGDEFAVILTDLVHGEDAGAVAGKFLEQFRAPFRLHEREHYVTPSIGISVFPADGDSAGQLLKNADIAMYRAKDQGKNRYQYYSAEMAAAAAERLALLSALRHAIDRHQLALHYQPQVDLRSGQITGVEALLRWDHPERGWVSPVLFIPLAEESGLIHEIGEWVLREACRQTRDWRDRGLARLRVAVNFSAHQFRQRRLAETVLRILDETGLPPAQLDIELTETALLQGDETSLAILRQLVAHGISVSLDDFGTGYSSLSYLKRFPIDTLKIDRSFVRDITHDPDDAAIARAIVSLAHSLGRKVVAEGVESDEQLALLRGYGCDGMQGDLFSPPVAAVRFEALLRGQARAAGS